MDARKREAEALRKRSAEAEKRLAVLYAELGKLALEGADPSWDGASLELRSAAESSALRAEDRIRKIEQDEYDLAESSRKAKEIASALRSRRESENELLAAVGAAAAALLPEDAPERMALNSLADKLAEAEARLRQAEASGGDAPLAFVGKKVKALMLKPAAAARAADLSRAFARFGKAALAGSGPEPGTDSDYDAAFDAWKAYGAEVSSLEAGAAEASRAAAEARARLEARGAADPRRAKAALAREAAEARAAVLDLDRAAGERFAAAAESAAVVAGAPADLEEGLELRAIARDAAARAARLEASLRASGLRDEAASIKRAIADHRLRIEASERACADLSRRLADAEAEAEALEAAASGAGDAGSAEAGRD